VTEERPLPRFQCLGCAKMRKPGSPRTFVKRWGSAEEQLCLECWERMVAVMDVGQRVVEALGGLTKVST
jgi:hypothetical protein